MTLKKILEGKVDLPRGDVLLLAIMWCMSEKDSGEFAEFTGISAADADMLFEHLLAHNDALHLYVGKMPPNRRFSK
jgi:hypothetical protein